MKNKIYKKLAITIISLLLTPSLFANFLKDANKISPLKKNKSNSLVYQLQKNYRDIYKLNKKSVVFISTEKTIKRKRYSNPFMDDPIFKEFFGERLKQQQKSRKTKGLGTGFIVSKVKTISLQFILEIQKKFKWVILL